MLKHLAKREGKWRIVPSPDELLILQRLDSPAESRGLDSGLKRIGRVVLSGVIEKSGDLVDFLTFIFTNKKSGVLVVLSEKAKKTLVFHRGDLRMATSNLAEDRIGAVLYRYGHITNEQLEEALGQAKGRRLGQVLVDQGVLSVHDLYKTIRRQIEDIFHSVLLFRTGEFYFYSMQQDASLPVQMNLSTHNLLMEGVRRIDEMSYFREKLPSSDVVLEICPEVPPKKLEEKESRVYCLIDGQKSVLDLGRESRLGEFEATKIVFHLLQMRYIRIVEHGEVTKGLKPVEAVEALHEVVETFNQVFRKIQAEVGAKGRREELAEDAESFFSGSTGYGDLFAGVKLQEDGAIDAERLLKNLEELDVKNKTDFLYQALNELMFFEMFSAGQALSQEDEKELRSRLNEIFEKINR